MNSVKLFEKLASYTWQRILSSEKFNISQGEETITDLNLLEIAMSQSSEVTVVKTAKYKEKDQGTDWEWWIGNNRIGYLRYAVQAKKIDKHFIHYKALGHKVDSEKQIDILERYAQNNRAIPLYCFYNYSQNTNLKPYWHCNLPPDNEQFGCTITPLKNVKQALQQRGKRTFDFLHSFSSTKPWRCLVRCPSLRQVYKYGTPTDTWDFDNVFVYPRLPTSLAYAMEMNSEFRPYDYQNQRNDNIIDVEENNFYGEHYPKRIVVANYLGDSL
jgi:hypothetical protein